MANVCGNVNTILVHICYLIRFSFDVVAVFDGGAPQGDAVSAAQPRSYAIAILITHQRERAFKWT